MTTYLVPLTEAEQVAILVQEWHAMDRRLRPAVFELVRQLAGWELLADAPADQWSIARVLHDAATCYTNEQALFKQMEQADQDRSSGDG